MADELYPGYDPLIDPNPITCWGMPTAEELEACAKAQREGVALWVGMTIISRIFCCGWKSGQKQKKK